MKTGGNARGAKFKPIDTINAWIAASDAYGTEISSDWKSFFEDVKKKYCQKIGLDTSCNDTNEEEERQRQRGEREYEQLKAARDIFILNLMKYINTIPLEYYIYINIINNLGDEFLTMTRQDRIEYINKDAHTLIAEFRRKYKTPLLCKSTIRNVSNDRALPNIVYINKLNRQLNKIITSLKDKYNLGTRSGRNSDYYYIAAILVIRIWCQDPQKYYWEEREENSKIDEIFKSHVEPQLEDKNNQTILKKWLPIFQHLIRKKGPLSTLNWYADLEEEELESQINARQTTQDPREAQTY